MPRIAAGPGDEQHSGPAAPLLVVDPDAIYLDGAHKPSSACPRAVPRPDRNHPVDAS